MVLLYSGGLDTSVMLKWIQDEYDAEVIALCIDLGQPDDDFEAVRRKDLDLEARSRAWWSTARRSSRASTSPPRSARRPATRADEMPLF